MVFKGRGVQKDEAIGAAWLKRAAEHGNPVAQNRLAHLYANGRGIDINPFEAAKWHLIARHGGKSDTWLDGHLETLSEEEQSRAEAAATAWMKQRQAGFLDR
jgi:hypothetical protein